MRRLDGVSRLRVCLHGVIAACSCATAFGQQPVPIDILALPVTPQGTTIVAAPGGSGPLLAAPVLAEPPRPVLQLPPPPSTTPSPQVASNTAVALPAASLPPTTTENNAGTMVSVDFGGNAGFVDLVMLEGMHGHRHR